MGKGYWIATYRSVSNPEALGEYAPRAAEIIQAHGGRFLARAAPVRADEAAGPQRCVVVEFDSVASAIAAYESAAYAEARAILEEAVEREILVVEGV